MLAISQGEFKISRQVFEKYSNVIFYENPSSGSHVCPCGRTDGQTDRLNEANSHFPQFVESALKMHFRLYISL